VTTFNLDDNQALYQIYSYSPGLIQINETKYSQSVIITPTQLIDHWPPQSISALSADSLRIIINFHPDVLLIGTGSQLIFPALEIYGELINAGIGVEIMDTSAACRTYNALSAENRNVVAALIIS